MTLRKTNTVDTFSVIESLRQGIDGWDENIYEINEMRMEWNECNEKRIV